MTALVTGPVKGRDATPRRSCRRRAFRAGLLPAVMLALAACAQPPTEVVDMSNVPELTRDAMVQVRVGANQSCGIKRRRSMTLLAG